MNSEEVILNIEGNQIKCGRKILTAHSEYFKAMLEGNFIEGSKDVIPIHDVDSKAFHAILATIYDNKHEIPEEDLLIVLQTASMLQFDHIKDICIDKLTNILSPTNCLNVWHICELLGIKELSLKAKYLALSRFEEIKDLDCLLELNINQFCKYLCNTKLSCENEWTIFDLGTKWYLLHKEKFDSKPERLKTLLLLLTCIDFNRLSYESIEEMKKNEHILSEKEIVHLLDDIMKLRKGDQESVAESSEARRFLTSNRKKHFSAPCILGYNYKALPPSTTTDVTSTYYYDKYRRRRNCLLFKSTNLAQYNSILMYHAEEKSFKEIITIPQDCYRLLQGFTMLGYKQYVYMLGGEYHLGRGKWNDKVWAFDTIKGKMEEKTNLPIYIRHFEACIAGDNLYIVGGTSALRVKSGNVYRYNLINDSWTTISELTVCSQSKCCEYKGNLLVISLNEKKGYLLKNDVWIILPFLDEQKLVQHYPLLYAVVSFEDYIYIKGSHNLIKLQQIKQNLVVLDYKSIRYISCDKMDSVLCDENTIYSFYMDIPDSFVTLELLDLRTSETSVIMQCVSEDDREGIEIGDVIYSIVFSTKLFNLFHYHLTDHDTYLNNFTMSHITG